MPEVESLAMPEERPKSTSSSAGSSSANPSQADICTYQAARFNQGTAFARLISFLEFLFLRTSALFIHMLKRFRSGQEELGKDRQVPAGEDVRIVSSEDLSPDILTRIFSLLPAENLVRCAATCQNWKAAAHGEALWLPLLKALAGDSWESFLWAEQHLRRSPCSWDKVTPMPSWRSLYLAKKQAPLFVVVDGGSGYSKFGWSHQSRPQFSVPTFLEIGNIETPTVKRLTRLYSTIFESLGTTPSQQPLLISEALVHAGESEQSRHMRHLYRSLTCSVLFDKLNVPALCVVDQATLALFSEQHVSGIVVNFGFRHTEVVPVLRGSIFRPVGASLLGLGSMRLTTMLSDLMDRSGIHYQSMFTVRVIKERLTYVAEDYEAELNGEHNPASCVVPPEGEFTLDVQRFQAPEIFFRPAMAGFDSPTGLQHLLADCIKRCAVLHPGETPEEAGWYQRVVLCGGTANMPGLAARLKREMASLLPPELSSGLHITPPSNGPFSAYVGGHYLANVSNFAPAWCVTNEQYRQYGMDIVHSYCRDDPPTERVGPKAEVPAYAWQ